MPCEFLLAPKGNMTRLVLRFLLAVGSPAVLPLLPTAYAQPAPPDKPKVKQAKSYVDAGLAAQGGGDSIDGTMSVGCSAPYAPVAGSAHRYKALTNVSWDIAKTNCKLTSASAYLAVPDDVTELMNLATAAGGLLFWIGIDDQAAPGTFVTQKNVPAAFLPWAAGQPDQSLPLKACVYAASATEIATEKCGTQHIAVCECAP